MFYVTVISKKEVMYMKRLEDYDYKSFLPSFINDEWIWNDSELNSLLAKANLELGVLNGFAL